MGQFSQALSAGRPADAVRLYAGLLLDGFHVDDAAEFERWLDGEQVRLAREYGEALKQLATAAEAAGAWGEAGGWWPGQSSRIPSTPTWCSTRCGCWPPWAIGPTPFGSPRVTCGGFGKSSTAGRTARSSLPWSGSAGGSCPPCRGRSRRQHPRRRPYHYLKAWNRPHNLCRPRRRPLRSGYHAGYRGPRRPPPSCSGERSLPGGVSRKADRGPRAPELHRSPALRNLSEDTSYAYVARGLHDELLTQLVKVASLRVVGRGSVGGYAETSKPLRQIGEELAVGSIVEAGVQVDGNRLRVTVQLLDPSTQAHLWAERYDRALDDAFAVQSDIAQRIVAALGARLTSAEGGAIAAPPTQVAGAYEYYLQGLSYHRRPGFLLENFRVAQQLYERALALDSGFALAHAALASVHVSMHKLRYDLSPSRLDLAQREADLALRLVPGLPQAHLAAAGVLYHRGGKYREALDQVKLGLRGAPNDPELWAWMGVVQLSLGQLGQRGRGVRARAWSRPAQCEHLAVYRGHVPLSPPLPGGHRGLPAYLGVRARSGATASGVERLPMAGPV